MGYIHCCAGLRKTRTYSISPSENYHTVQFDYLEKCPICGHTVAQLTRVDFKDRISICRKINKKAKKLFENLKNSIITSSEIAYSSFGNSSSFYLNYSEYGVKKKCYSNLKSLKIGLFENKELSIKNKFHITPENYPKS